MYFRKCKLHVQFLMIIHQSILGVPSLRTEYKHGLGVKRGLQTVYIKTALER